MSATYELTTSTRTRVSLRKVRPPFVHLDFLKSYSKVNAFNLAVLSALAYQDKDPVGEFLFHGNKPETRKASFLESPNVHSAFLTECSGDLLRYEGTFTFPKDDATDTQSFTFRTESYLLIACRGTENLNDGLTDANFTRVPYKEGVGLVHEGFYKAFLSIKAGIDQALADSKDLPLICCGHSLGAALATLVATYARRKYKKEVLLYTYGCPLVGDADFAKHFSTVETFTSYRFVNNQDIVTMVPFPYASLRVELLPAAIFSLASLIPATFDFKGRPYSHIGQRVFVRRMDGGAFSVDPTGKSPIYLRLPDSITVHEERPKWEKVLNWAKASAKDHSINNYVSITGSDLKHAVHDWLQNAATSADNGRKLLAYLEREIAALEKGKAKAEREALLPLNGAAADATATGSRDPGRLTPAERLRLVEDVLRDKCMERTLQKSRITALSSPAYRAQVLKELLDRPMTPSLRKEFEYQDKNLSY